MDIEMESVHEIVLKHIWHPIFFPMEQKSMQKVLTKGPQEQPNKKPLKGHKNISLTVGDTIKLKWKISNWYKPPRSLRPGLQKRIIKHDQVPDRVDQMLRLVDVIRVRLNRPILAINLVDQALAVIKL